MGRPRIRLKTDSFDGRNYTTTPVPKNGKTLYSKVHLRTKDEDVARRRLTALEGIDDPEEARCRINHLARAGSEALERARLAAFVPWPATQNLIQRLWESQPPVMGKEGKRLKQLEVENRRLKRLVADLTLDKQNLQETARGKR